MKTKLTIIAFALLAINTYAQQPPTAAGLNPSGNAEFESVRSARIFSAFFHKKRAGACCS